ncbi:MAG: restriction endonuclease subunit S, partial [Candidatus Paceibacterota bacterium]
MGLNKIDALVKEVKETKKMDISKWGVFNLIDVFPEYSHGQRLTKADRVLGNLPLITAGQFNNGIAQYVKGNGRNKIFEDCVTIDMFGNCFYQEGKFVCDDNVYPIKNVKNKFVGLFLASIFSKSINFDFKKQF